MKKFMEEKFIPVASKIASLKYLVAIRDAFIAIMPITMVGSFSVLLNVFFRDIPTEAGWTGFVEKMEPIISINGNVWFGSLAIISLVFVFALGYNIAKLNGVNEIAGGLVTFASFFAVMPQVAKFAHELPDVAISAISQLEGLGFQGLEVTKDGILSMSVERWGLLDTGYVGATGLFTAMIVGLISGIVYSYLMNKNIGFKLPESVPPAVNKAFAAIIPGVLAIYLSGIVAYLVTRFTGQNISDLILTYIQKPLLGLSQGLGSVIIMVLLIQLFWFFGIHGTNVLAPILDGVYLPALLENSQVYQATHDVSQLPYIWTRGSFDAYAQMGGTGITIALIIAIFIFSKREDSRAIAKLAAPMGIFNINEPVTYGMPIVLNPIYFIPWIIIPPIAATIGYFFTKVGLIPPVYVVVPWITPPGIYAFLATGGSFLAALISLLNIALAVIIYAPFVLMANRTKDETIDDLSNEE